MRCPYCEAQNEDGAEVCRLCGRPLLEDAPVEPTPPEVIPRINGNRNWGKLITVLVVVSAVLIFGYIELVFDPYGQPPEWSHYASAQNSLRYMQVAQEEYFTDIGEYACNLAQLSPYFQPDPAVVTLILDCGRTEWMAAACPDQYPAVFIFDSASGGLRETRKIYRSAWYHFLRKFSMTGRDEARRQVREELGKMANAQEQYRERTGHYAGSVSALSPWYQPGANLTTLVAKAYAEEFIIVGTHNKQVSLMAYHSQSGFTEP